MITEIGSLVGIVNSLLTSAKTGRELFGGSKRRLATESVRNAQERLAGIADQLYQSVALSKMLPLWLREHATVDLYTDALTDDEVKLLDSTLRQLISDSIHDHFSGTFFMTNFTGLPGVEPGIKLFREKLIALESQMNGILPGDATSWRRSWPIVKVRMTDLRVEAVKLENVAEEVHASLLRELRDAASLS